MKTPHALAVIPALLFALAFAGCADQPLASVDAAAPPLEDAAPALHKVVQRPFKGDCEMTFDPPSLPPPPVFNQIDTGTCRLTHLGRAQFYSVKEINFLAGTQTTTEAAFTAANGDILRAIGTGTGTPTGPGLVSFFAVLTFVGGTGRFANASGEAHVVGEAALFTGTTSLEITHGWIAYDASDRSGR